MRLTDTGTFTYTKSRNIKTPKKPLFSKNDYFDVTNPSNSYQADRFVSTFPLHFGRLKTGQDFERELEHSGLTLEAFLHNAIQPLNLRAQGSHAQVYTIPLFPDFLLRIPKGGLPAHHALHILPNIPLSHLALGQPVAFIGENSFKSTSNGQVVRKQSGEALGIPLEDNGVDYRISDTQADLYYRKQLQTVAAMPQKAFDDLAYKLMCAEREGYNWDCDMPQNLLLDTKTQEFNPVDINFDNRFGPTDLPYVLDKIASCIIDLHYINDTKYDLDSLQPYYSELLKKIIKTYETVVLPEQVIHSGLKTLCSLAGKSVSENKTITPELRTYLSLTKE